MKSNAILPVSIQNYLEGYSVSESITGRLNDTILKYKNDENNILYLKYGKGIAAEDIQTEKEILLWLQKKNLNTPKVISSHKNKNCFYLLTVGLIGLPIYEYNQNQIKKYLEIIATALKELHATNTSDCPVENSLTKDLEKIKKYIRLNVIDVSKFYKYTNGKTPIEIFNLLVSQKETIKNNVTTHGDFCLPNILVDSNSRFGFIDLGDAGIGDKYKDLSSIEGSIIRNFGKKWISVFYKYYDPNLKVDRKKIKFFQYIDYFDYCLNIKKYNALTTKI